MPDTDTNAPVSVVTKYEKAYKVAKYAAREHLRLEKAVDLLDKIRNLKVGINNTQDIIKKNEHKIAMLDFEVRIAQEQNNPDLEKITKDTAELKEILQKSNKTCAEAIAMNEKSIKERQEELFKLEKGETKMPYEKIAELATCLAKKRIETEYLDGSLDQEAETVEG